MTDYLFEKEIRVFGMKRSGNSAVLGFLWGHFGVREAIHLHNTNLTFHPSYSLKKGVINKFSRGVSFEKRKLKPKYFINSVEHLPILDIGICLKKGYCYDAERKIFAIKYGRDEFAKDVYNIVLLRSPHNHLASILKNKSMKGLFRGGRYYIEFADLWVQYAEEILSITSHIPDRIPVLFDKLVGSVDYRKSISDVLGFVHSDSGINNVPRKVGSSFDGRKYKRNAQEMKVLDRWKYLIDPGKKVWWFDECKEKLMDSKVVEYTKELFSVDLKELFE